MTSLPLCDKFMEDNPGPRYNVLVVDDEEDIRKVTKLCLKNMTYMGYPVKVTEAASKAEAIKLLETNLGHAYCCAIIDVVMESDHAGLELIKYIRETIKNDALACYLRTGQPGQAPEREVMEKLNIDGYILKTELTDEKLYSITLASIKSTLRAFPYVNGMNQLSLFSYGAYAKDAFMKRIDEAYKFTHRMADKPGAFPGHYYTVFGSEYHSGTGKGFSAEMRDEIMALPPTKVLGPIEYRAYKDLHCLTSVTTGSTYVGHTITWVEDWQRILCQFWQILDFFVMNSRY